MTVDEVIALPLEKLLPHAGAMILLDKVCRFDEDGLTALATVKLGPYSLDDGALPPWLGLELMAQAIGAWAGCRAQLAGRSPDLGFLLGTRRYQCHIDKLPAGMVLTVSAKRSFIDNSGMAVFECTLADDGRLLGQARLNIYQPPNAQVFMQERLS